MSLLLSILIFSVFSRLLVTLSMFCISWTQTLLKRKHWRKRRRGRPAVTLKTVFTVLLCAYYNPHYGYRRICAEFMKITKSSISRETVRKILAGDFTLLQYRKRLPKGTLLSGNWKMFLASLVGSIWAMDIKTVDVVTVKGVIRHWILFVMNIKSREVLKASLTDKADMAFLYRELGDLMQKIAPDEKPYLIHDNGSQFKYLDYERLGFRDLPIRPYTPNMNAYVERLIRSFKEEALDKVPILSSRQLAYVVSRYIHYYNHYRPHQGLGGKTPVPSGSPHDKEGKIRFKNAFFDLYRHTYRKSA